MTAVDRQGTSGLRAAEVAAELARLRAGVLAGRGPGAGPVEVDRHTRGRTRIGDEPVPRLREQVSRQAAVARRDAEALPRDLARDLADDRARLAGSVRALTDEIVPAARQAGQRLRRAVPWCLVALQTLLLIRAARRR